MCDFQNPDGSPNSSQLFVSSSERILEGSPHIQDAGVEKTDRTADTPTSVTSRLDRSLQSPIIFSSISPAAHSTPRRSRAGTGSLPLHYDLSYGQVQTSHQSASPASFTSRSSREEIQLWSAATHPGDVMQYSPEFSDRVAPAEPHADAVEGAREIREWTAFLSKLQKIGTLRIQALDVRKQFMKLLGQDFGVGERFESVRQELERKSRRLYHLDQALIDAELDAQETAPRLTERMTLALPNMLARHQLDFVGEPSVGGETSASSQQDLPLDTQARELYAKQTRVNQLEEDVLRMRHQRDLLKNHLLLDAEGDPEQMEEDQRKIHELNNQLDTTVRQLEAIQNDIRDVTDRSVSPSTDHGFDMVFIPHDPEMSAQAEQAESNEDVRSLPTIMAMSDVATVLHRPLEGSSGPSSTQLQPPVARSRGASSRDSGDQSS